MLWRDACALRAQEEQPLLHKTPIEIIYLVRILYSIELLPSNSRVRRESEKSIWTKTTKYGRTYVPRIERIWSLPQLEIMCQLRLVSPLCVWCYAKYYIILVLIMYLAMRRDPCEEKSNLTLKVWGLYILHLVKVAIELTKGCIK